MKPEAIAEITLSEAVPDNELISPPSSFGFILTFGTESFSAAVVPDGSGLLQPGIPQRVRLRFLVEAVRTSLAAGREFAFQEGRRTGCGRILEVCNA